MGKQARVLIVMGSDSDLPVMSETRRALDELGIAWRMTVVSAHRSPEKVVRLAREAIDEGISVIIAGAGAAAHLAGAMAAHVTIPVIGVPIDSSPLSGWDALLSTIQMPPGVPVAAMAVGKAGAYNAGILAAQILGIRDPEIQLKLLEAKQEQAQAVEKKAESVENALE